MSTDRITIALDVMSGDEGVDAVVPAAIETLDKHNNVDLILVGDADAIDAKLADHKSDGRIEVRHASEVVTMDDPPALALRGKRDSSMRQAINTVKEGAAQACVSAGNTGALMATARYVLKTLPGIDRPAISTAIPTVSGHTHMLDLGANIDSSADHLFQFAVMGSVLVNAVDNLDEPRVALLNIGEEAIKGNDQVKEASRMLKESELNYVGYIEGDGIYSGSADVVVCDGFVGNISLKTSEGVAKMIAHFMREEFKRGLLNKLSGVIALPVINAFKKRIDPRRYNGASLLGLQGIVIKSHGSADSFSFQRAIEIAILEVTKNIPNQIDSQLERHLVSS
ncbi:MAG: phosphate acyltransferase PlsX [Pseudomonadota bacterium]